MGQVLTEKTAIITGAGRGIGRATALALANEGVAVGLIARTEKDIEQLAKEIRSLRGRAAFAVADVSDPKQVEAAVQKLTDELGTIDILINNAGIGKYGKFMELETEDWQNMLNINLMGMVHMTKAVLPQMVEKQGGDIVNISSSSGLKGTKGSSAYSASKFAVLGMSEALMQEVRPDNIRVFALAPSRVVTSMTDSGNETEQEKEKFMQPEDIAEYIVSQLKLNPRIFIPLSKQWATNPF
ncbi:3-ketoacyl-ACP reductase [Planococcus sp. CP5-4]|uniref:3-ketoacyl-ACP reductase n=1 Tax=unclassified Planococcus (in: firmicutes) TaxID=2662419 RepID=UPI001C21D958|nr:3-ketoacyl-ACP reductase [Planococcus sp. CP5-4]MBU9674388.1 3-ketoacyl-ACP reductase [Planococcus sp. CP5-4_YE]MBV0909024.1 3-ketoacyl-ACP reductase [Planococcus sp. CP5-4_UN]MBW6065080.1 3-ketoacyl-ACP reductase [Planococcus sp. CP5-4]